MLVKKRWTIFAATIALLGHSSVAGAADTIEPYPQGAVDVELQVGLNGVGGAARALGSDFLVGYGLHRRISAYAAVGMSGIDRWGERAIAFAGGAYGTLLDTEHVDLDLSLELSSEHAEESRALGLTPLLEFNLDSDNEMQGAGLYLRVGTPVTFAEQGDTITMESTVGAYYTLASIHQLLLELSWQNGLSSSAEPFGWEVLAAGYNVAFHESVELIVQAGLELAEQPAFSILGGVIVTLSGAS